MYVFVLQSMQEPAEAGRIIDPLGAGVTIYCELPIHAC